MSKDPRPPDSSSRPCYALILACLASGTLPAAEPVAVETRTLAQVAVRPEISAPASCVSLNDSRISAEINARVVALPVRVGDVVEKDATLAELDCVDYQLMARRAEAEQAVVEAKLEFAVKQLERARNLASKQTVAEEVLNQRESEVGSLRAEQAASRSRVASARRDLGKCVVRSPFKAVVVERLGAVGQFATPGTALVRIVDLSDLEVSAQVPSSQAEELAGAGTIEFEHNGRRYPLELRTLVPVVNAQSRDREVRLSFRGEAALPGAAGQLIWRSVSLQIPADYIVKRDDRLGVFVKDGGTARFHLLPDAEAGRPVAIDLPPQTEIITAGQYVLNDGDPLSAGTAVP